ncbi:MAG TPA: ROK family transcriptional regulator [Actinocatenispora sp.]
MSRRPQPGTPRLLRALNDRAALELLLAHGPLTRARLGELTGLSKVTASQLVERLESRGLVERVGVSAGGRGPSAQLYAVVRGAAYVVGMAIGPTGVTAASADITGAECGRVQVDADISDDPVGLVHAALAQVAASAGITVESIRHVVLGSPGVIDPRSGEVSFSWELPRWHRGLLAALTADLNRPVRIVNDVNLAAVAEHRLGAAAEVDDFVLLWCDRGMGVGVMLSGRLYQGVMGAAGEVGYLPVPGVELVHGVSRQHKAPYSALAGAEPIRALAAEYGFAGVGADAAIEAAAADPEKGGPLLDEVARRIALGAAAVSVVLDPGLVVLAGEIGQAGGAQLAERVGREVRELAPVAPRVVTTGVAADPVLHGAVLTALDSAREEIFDSATEAPDPADAAT